MVLCISYDHHTTLLQATTTTTTSISSNRHHATLIFAAAAASAVDMRSKPRVVASQRFGSAVGHECSLACLLGQKRGECGACEKPPLERRRQFGVVDYDDDDDDDDDTTTVMMMMLWLIRKKYQQQQQPVEVVTGKVFPIIRIERRVALRER